MNGPVTDAQLDEIWRACSEIAAESDVREASRNLASRLTAIIGTPAIVFRRDVSPWKVVATSGAETQLNPTAAVDHLRRLVPAFDASYRIIRAGDSVWTPLPLDEQVPWQSVLLLSGDWQQGNGASWLPRLARTASLALRHVASSEAGRKTGSIATSAYGLARRLGQVSGEDAIYRVIVESAARAASARLAGLSVYRPRDGAISVAATFGYPSESVGHVRIMPGAGIIGGVFASRKPLLVKDTGKVPGLTPRSRRYQTSSFMALPIVSGRDALGVVTLADREDGRAFSGTDLSAARMVTAVSCLALVREQLSQRGEELAHAAAVDPVTGMFNRRYLETRLSAELERSRRSSQSVGLLMLDVDTFKDINDLMGHQSGDAVLRKIAEIMRRSVRASDVCTRYGGDEFAIIVPEHGATALQTAERIRSRIEAFRWETLGVPQNLHVTVSIGVAIGAPGESPEPLIGRADQNLYLAKTMGRNAVFPAELP